MKANCFSIACQVLLIQALILLHVSTLVDSRSGSVSSSRANGTFGSKQGKGSKSVHSPNSECRSIQLLSSLGAVLGDIVNIQPQEKGVSTAPYKWKAKQAMKAPTEIKGNDFNVGLAATAGTAIALSGVVLIVDSAQEHLQKMIQKTRIALSSLGQVLSSRCDSLSKSLIAFFQDSPCKLGRILRITGDGLESVMNVCLDCFSEGADWTILQCTRLAHSMTKTAKCVLDICTNEMIPAVKHSFEYCCLGVDLTVSTIVKTMTTWASLTMTEFKNALTFAGQGIQSVSSFFASNLIPTVNLVISQTLRVIATVGQFLHYYLDEFIYFGRTTLQFIWLRTDEMVESSCDLASSLATSIISSLCLFPRMLGNLAQSFGSLVVPSIYLVAKSPFILLSEGGHFFFSCAHSFLSGCGEAICKLELPVEWVDIDECEGGDRMSVVPYMSVPLGWKREKGQGQVLVLKPDAQKVLYIASSLTGVLEVLTNVPKRR